MVGNGVTGIGAAKVVEQEKVMELLVVSKAVYLVLLR